MATSSFTNIASWVGQTSTEDTIVRDFITKFLAAMDAIPTLTRVTGLNTNGVRASNINGQGRNGDAPLESVVKVGTGGTFTTSTTTGTLVGASWTEPLDPLKDIGKPIKISYSSGGGVNLAGCWITAISADLNTVSVAGLSTLVAPAGGVTVTASIGWFSQNGLGVADLMGIGYAVWRFNDPLQATAPVFIRARVIHSSYSPSGFLIAFHVGTEVDSKGNLMGSAVSGTAEALLGYNNNNNSESVSERSFIFSHDAGRFSFGFNVNSTGNGRSLITISRSVDEDGVQTDDFVQVCSFTPSNSGISTHQHVLDYKTGIRYPNNAEGVGFVTGMHNNASANSTNAFDGNVPYFPVYPFLGRLHPHCGDVIVGKSLDFPNDSNVTHDGKNYRIMSQSPTNGGDSINSTVNVMVGMRYE